MPDKETSWAPVLEKMDQTEPEAKEVEAMVATNKAEHALNVAILQQLSRIAVAMEDANAMYRLINNIDVEIEGGEVEDDDTGEEAGPPASRSKDGPKPIPIKIPENFKDDKEIETFYRSQVSAVKGEDGEPLLDQETLNKVQIMVGESDVRIKIPYMKDTNKFRTIAGELRRLNGEYVSDGANTHYRMPKPPTS